MADPYSLDSPCANVVILVAGTPRATSLVFTLSARSHERCQLSFCGPPVLEKPSTAISSLEPAAVQLVKKEVTAVTCAAFRLVSRKPNIRSVPAGCPGVKIVTQGSAGGSALTSACR